MKGAGFSQPTRNPLLTQRQDYRLERKLFAINCEGLSELTLRAKVTRLSTGGLTRTYFLTPPPRFVRIIPFD